MILTGRDKQHRALHFNIQATQEIITNKTMKGEKENVFIQIIWILKDIFI